MKTKIIFTFAVVALIFGSYVPSASACSLVEGYKFATPQEVIKADGDVFVGKILASGKDVVGEVLEVQQGEVASHVVVRSEGTSCDNKFSFDKDMYFVAVSPSDESSVIEHSTIDKQFTYFYKTLDEANVAAKTLLDGKDPIVIAEPATGYEPVGHTLRPGMKGNDVFNLQDALNKVLPTIMIYPPVYPANPDGVYGKQTMQAVMNFQKQAGITADGIAGAKTQQALSDALKQ